VDDAESLAVWLRAEGPQSSTLSINQENRYFVK
jgi:hypothetical protein